MLAAIIRAHRIRRFRRAMRVASLNLRFGFTLHL